VPDPALVRPAVSLLDAVALELDETGLRQEARLAARSVPGRTTSRSYRYPWALVANWAGPVGVDIERVDPSLDERFALSIASYRERDALVQDPPTPADVASLWSVKEAIAKALGSPVQRDPRTIEAPALWRPAVSMGVIQTLGHGWSAGAVSVPEGYVGWVAWATRTDRLLPGDPSRGTNSALRPQMTDAAIWPRFANGSHEQDTADRRHG
jgi:phosphopantetheinyl transferase (holo-ACP synthase)